MRTASLRLPTGGTPAKRSRAETSGTTATAFGGQRCPLFEVTTQLGVGPPPHVQHREDESFYVLEGEFEFSYGEETFRIGAGSLLYIPEGNLHAHKNVSEGVGRMLVSQTLGACTRGSSRRSVSRPTVMVGRPDFEGQPNAGGSWSKRPSTASGYRGSRRVRTRPVAGSRSPSLLAHREYRGYPGRGSGLQTNRDASSTDFRHHLTLIAGSLLIPLGAWG
jgi:quercetin dioxygenase-like cupin family protein